MDILWWLQEVAILIVVYKITAAESDLLESLQLKEENPPELNDFLNSVLEHQKDFNAVEEAARNYQKMKKEVHDFRLDDTLGANINPYNGFYGKKIEEKRHITHYNGKRKFRNLGLLPPNMRNKFQRTRRGIESGAEKRLEMNKIKQNQNLPEVIMLEEISDDSVQKRQPIIMEEGGSKIKHNLPSQIYVNPQGERVQKRTPEKVVVQSEAESGEIGVDVQTKETRERKQVLDLATEVHHGYKSKGGKVMRDDMRGNQESDVYYVDLGNGADKEGGKNKKPAYARKLRRQGFYYPPGQYVNQVYHPRPQSLDYPHYPNARQQINDDVGFERALSYEVEPGYPNEPEMYNNPAGNNLYSVDAGRPDNFQPFYPQVMYQPVYGPPGMGQHQYPLQNQMGISNEKFFIDNDDNMKRVQTTTTDSSTNSIQKSSDGKKIVEQVGKGFVEITKSRRDETGQSADTFAFEKKSLIDLTEKSPKNSKEQSLKKNTNKNNEQSSLLSKHALHPLRVKDTHVDEEEESLLPNEDLIEDQNDIYLDKRYNQDEDEHFQARNLKFIDYENTNLYNQDDNIEEVPLRSRRDFLDSVGMKNEEDYSEDNPDFEEMHVNNTDVHNDTHIKKTTYSHAHQKDDMKHIATILEETNQTTSRCSYHGEAKRTKNNTMPLTYLDEHTINKMGRKSRDADKDIEVKILANKNKIYNGREKYTNHVQVRQDSISDRLSVEIPKLNLRRYMHLKHKLDKKEDRTFEESTETTEQAKLTIENSETTTFMTTSMMMEQIATEQSGIEQSGLEQNTVELIPEVDPEYKKMAHQMDVENEKLAHVINGHLASQIVTLVFDTIIKKNKLKTKISSGLSRKHVNFAESVDSNIFKGNETEDVNEACLMRDQVSKVLNKLVVNQVRRKLCQRLPEELKEFLNLITNVKISSNKQEFFPNDQQGDFLFTYQENRNGDTPFDVGKLQNILVKLEGLLLAYNNMNSDCQNKAEPVRDYIEKHVKMLKKIVNCPGNNCEDKFVQAKRNIEHPNNDLLEKQLESVGLGKNQEFIPNFDLNQLVKNKMASNSLKTKKRDTQVKDSKSVQYKKLQLAIEKTREKRENENKIAEMFSGKQKRSLNKIDIDYEEPVVYSLG